MYRLSVATLCACLSTCTVPHHGIKFAAAQAPEPNWFCVSHRSGAYCRDTRYDEMQLYINEANARAKRAYEEKHGKAKRTRQPQQR